MNDSQTGKNYKRGRKCVVYGCSKSTLDGVALFAFPKSENLAKQWNKAVSTTRQWPGHTKWSLICSDHFSDDSFDESRECKRKYGIPPLPHRLLVEGAIPQIKRPKRPSSYSGSHDVETKISKIGVAFAKRERARVSLT